MNDKYLGTDMRGKNKYYKRAHISEAKCREIIKLFANDLPASTASEITGISRVTINKIYYKLRTRIAQICEYVSSLSEGAASSAWSTRVEVIHVSSDQGMIFSTLKCNGYVYATIASGAIKQRSQKVAQGREDINSTITLDVLNKDSRQICFGNKKAIQVGGSKDRPFRGNMLAGDIESFWLFSMRRLAKFNGIANDKLYLHLKECEYRFHYRSENLYSKLLAELRKNPL